MQDSDTFKSFLNPRLQDKSDPHSDQTKFNGLLHLTIAGVLRKPEYRTPLGPTWTLN